MKINVSKKEEIKKELDVVQKKCTARTVNVGDIDNSISKIESKLETLLPKKEWKGLKFHLDPNAQQFPAAYKFTPESTHIYLERGSKDWFVVRINRTTNGSTQKIIPMNLHHKKEEITRFVTEPKNW